MDAHDRAARAALLYGMLPLWAAAGVADWAWHRASRIERTAGLPEAVSHLLLALEGGAQLLCALYCEPDAGAIGALWGLALVHEATAVADVAYAAPRRRVTQGEDHTHSFLEALPFANAAIVCAMHPEQTRALLGLGTERARRRLRLTGSLPSPLETAAVLVAGAVSVGVYVEEIVRCLRCRNTSSR